MKKEREGKEKGEKEERNNQFFAIFLCQDVGTLSGEGRQTHGNYGASAALRMHCATRHSPLIVTLII